LRIRRGGAGLLAVSVVPESACSVAAFCIRQHTSAYVTSAYVSIRQHTSAYVSIRQHTSAFVSIRQHPSAYVSIRQHTFMSSCSATAPEHERQLLQLAPAHAAAADVSIRPHAPEHERQLLQLYRRCCSCTGTAAAAAKASSFDAFCENVCVCSSSSSSSSRRTHTQSR
jgi:hypothetical protein